MLKEKVIEKKNGIKTEDCAVFAQAAGMFESDVYIIKDSKKVNAKSLMGLLSLNMQFGDVVYLSTEGIDDVESNVKLMALL